MLFMASWAHQTLSRQQVRNEIAVREILAESRAEHDVVSLWGAGHWNGIHKELVRNGFTLDSVDWVTAIAK